MKGTEEQTIFLNRPSHSDWGMAPLTKICTFSANDSSSEDGSEDVGNQNDACENEINQYEDGEQQSIREGLFDNNEIEETACGGRERNKWKPRKCQW